MLLGLPSVEVLGLAPMGGLGLSVGVVTRGVTTAALVRAATSAKVVGVDPDWPALGRPEGGEGVTAGGAAVAGVTTGGAAVVVRGAPEARGLERGDPR